MSSPIKELLTKWGLPSEVINKFEEQDVSVEQLGFLSKVRVVELVDKLIPKEGPKSQFLHHWEKFHKEKNNTVENEGVNSDASDGDGEDDDAGLFNQRKRRRLDNATLQSILDVPDVNELHKSLKQSMPGLLVLGFYRAQKRLDDHCRDILCQQVIYTELGSDYNKSLERDDFDTISDAICELFRSETKDTWYLPVTKNKKSTVLGRLRTKYYAVRKKLRQALLIPSEEGPSETVVNNENNNENLGDLGEEADDVNYQWLLENSEPWDEVVGKWELTSVRRAKVLKEIGISPYLNKFPAITEGNGWKLIALDCSKEFPAFDTSLQTLWEEYSKFLITLIRQEKKRFLMGRQYSTLSAERKFLAIILELPHLFKIRSLPKSSDAPKSSKDIWRASFQEITDSLCLNVNSIAEIDEKLTERRAKLAQYYYQLQAVPIVLGKEGNIRQSFIVLDNFRWEVASPFEALEAAFKISFGLGALYPVESRHIFLFLQRTLYNLTTPKDFDKDTNLRTHVAGRLKDFQLYSNKH